MSSKPTPLPQFLPLALSFMRLPSSSSLILASLAVTLSSSLSALAAPVGDGSDSPSSPAPAPPHAPVLWHVSIRHGSDDRAQVISAPTSYIITFISDIATDNLLTSSLVDEVTAPFPPALANLIHSILDPAFGNMDEDSPVGFPSPSLPSPRSRHVGRQAGAGQGGGGGKAPPLCQCPP